MIYIVALCSGFKCPRKILPPNHEPNTLTDPMMKLACSPDFFDKNHLKHLLRWMQ